MELSLRFVIVFDSLLLICFTYKIFLKKMSFLFYIYISQGKNFGQGPQEQITGSTLAITYVLLNVHDL